MEQLTKQNNFVYLFFSLIILLFSSSVVVEFPGGLGEDIFSFVTLLMLFVSIKSLNTDATWKWTVYSIIVVFILLTMLSKFFTHQFSVYFIFTHFTDFLYTCFYDSC